MKEIVAMSQSDLTIIRKSVAMNPSTIINSFGNDNRPLQLLNSRTIRWYKGSDTAEVAKLSTARQLTRDYAAFSILILVPVILVIALWYFGFFAFCCHPKKHDTDTNSVDKK